MYETLKRIMDVVAAAFALVVSSPFFLVTALGVFVFLGRPIFCLQVRPGRDGIPFLLIKFRTMTEQRGPEGTPLSDAARLTAFGRFLRATSLDELPQLWNILKGDMGFVGPRPLLTSYLALYTPEQARRHEVRPGLTGWAQVNGRNNIDWAERLAMDVWYVDNRSFALDLYILAKTVWVVLTGAGIAKAGNVTMPAFTGTVSPSLGSETQAVASSPLSPTQDG